MNNISRSFSVVTASFLSALLLLIFLWWDAVEHLVYIISSVDTFSHGQIIPFVSLWLIWNRRETLKKAEAFIWLPGVVVLFFACLLWYAGEILEFKLAGHLAVITAIQAFVLIFFGPIIYQKLLFPCLFLFLIVPVGHDIIPIMQQITANMVVWILGVIGVPYEADGVLITLSSGVYEVAQACAGVRFLFTSIVTGILLAHLVFHKWRKRLAMIVAAAAIPIFANVIRVLGILLIAEATDQSFAKGVDHIVYGWVFLSLILLMLISVAYKFADDEEDGFKPVRFSEFKPSRPIMMLGTVATTYILLTATSYLAPKGATYHIKVNALSAPTCENCGIRLLSEEPSNSSALFSDADSTAYAHYRIAADQITVATALYCPQRPHSRLVQIGNVVSGRNWQLDVGGGSRSLQFGNWEFKEEIFRLGAQKKKVWSSYYIAGKGLSEPLQAKVATALERFEHGVSAGALMVVSSKFYGDERISTEVIKKLFSTFPPDSFLWSEIKPTLKGHSVCVG